eukprot:150940_1
MYGVISRYLVIYLMVNVLNILDAQHQFSTSSLCLKGANDDDLNGYYEYYGTTTVFSDVTGYVWQNSDTGLYLYPWFDTSLNYVVWQVSDSYTQQQTDLYCGIAGQSYNAYNIVDDPCSASTNSGKWHEKDNDKWVSSSAYTTSGDACSSSGDKSDNTVVIIIVVVVVVILFVVIGCICVIYKCANSGGSERRVKPRVTNVEIGNISYVRMGYEL